MIYRTRKIARGDCWHLYSFIFKTETSKDFNWELLLLKDKIISLLKAYFNTEFVEN